ncbi:MAG: hypothetical protein M3503_01980 [Actinomycetota bacterium]|nr:hypothetical protein [Actinomycetota bacterium]
MLWFERHAVASLTETTDEGARTAIAAFVDGTLKAMPEHLRAGVAAESLGLGLWAKLRRTDPGTIVGGLALSPIGLLRQYERLLGSLVLFAEYELAVDRTT